MRLQVLDRLSQEPAASLVFALGVASSTESSTQSTEPTADRIDKISFIYNSINSRTEESTGLLVEVGMLVMDQ